MAGSATVARRRATDSFLHDRFDTVCERHLARTIDVDVRWGSPSQFLSGGDLSAWGYFEHCRDDSDAAVVMCPALQRPWVPLYVIDSIAYHEACHAFLWVTTGDCDSEHGAAITSLDTRFHLYARANDWMRRNELRVANAVKRLMSRRR